jgi:hypothetical protein
MKKDSRCNIGALSLPENIPSTSPPLRPLRLCGSLKKYLHKSQIPYINVLTFYLLNA